MTLEGFRDTMTKIQFALRRHPKPTDPASFVPGCIQNIIVRKLQRFKWVIIPAQHGLHFCGLHSEEQRTLGRTLHLSHLGRSNSGGKIAVMSEDGN